MHKLQKRQQKIICGTHAKYTQQTKNTHVIICECPRRSGLNSLQMTAFTQNSQNIHKKEREKERDNHKDRI